MKDFLGDVKYAFRALARRPGFTIVVLLTLGLGIGINATVYTLTSNLLFRPLPFPDPERMAVVVSTFPEMGWTSGSVSILEVEDVQERSKLVQSVSYFASSSNPTLMDGEVPERLNANFVTSSYFSALQARPALGRIFLPAEDRPGGSASAILSHDFWRSHFGGDPKAVGAKINLTGQPFTVVGVMPADFQDIRNDFEQTDIWLPFSAALPVYGPMMFENYDVRRFLGVVRLRDGVSLEQAQAEIDEIARQLEQEQPSTNEGRGLRLVPPYEWYFEALEGPAKVLAVGAILVLFFCCVNIANLLVVRGRARLREIAIRAALGAARAQLIRQVLVESFILAVLGGILGVLIAWWAVKTILAFGGLDLPPFADIQVDSGILVISLLLTLLTGMLFGLLPAWQLARTDLRDSLHPTGHKGGRRGVWQRYTIAIVEVALAAVLLVGAGLTIKSFYRLANTPLGFDTRNLLTMRLQFQLQSNTPHEMAEKLRLLSENILRDVNALPGTESAVLWGPSMLADARISNQISPPGVMPGDPRGQLPVQQLVVSPGALKALGITLLQGRDFTPADREPGPPVPMIVDQRLANRLWPGEDPIGKRFYRGDNPGNEGVVVGVAANVLHRGRMRNDDQIVGDMYVPFLEEPSLMMSLLIRYKGDPAGTLDSVRRALVGLQPDLVPYDVYTMEDRLARVESSPRLNVTLLSLYGLTAILLAILGIYGVLAYSVQQRTPEMAVRSSFGALPQNLLWMVIRQGMFSAILGLVIGLGAAIVLSKYLESLLYQVSRTDLTMYGGVALLLTLTAFAACYLPARRASLVDPLEALRMGE